MLSFALVFAPLSSQCSQESRPFADEQFGSQESEKTFAAINVSTRRHGFVLSQANRSQIYTLKAGHQTFACRQSASS